MVSEKLAPQDDQCRLLVISQDIVGLQSVAQHLRWRKCVEDRCNGVTACVPRLVTLIVCILGVVTYNVLCYISKGREQKLY